MKTSKNNSSLGSTEPRGDLLTFEASQEFLQRAARQLRVWDDGPARRLRRYIADFGRRFVLGSLIKAVRWGSPEEDVLQLKEQTKYMDLKNLKKLELRLRLTPERLAVRYLRWIFRSLGTSEPNPLRGLLKEMATEIESRFTLYTPVEVYEGAEQKVFCLASLLCSALIALTDAFCAVLLFDAFAAVSASAGAGTNRNLVDRLVERHNELRIWESAVKIIEDERLHAEVLTSEWRTLLDRNQLRCADKAGGVSPRGQRPVKPLTTDECQEQARYRVNTLMQTAMAKANLTDCHELVFRLAQARLRLLSAVSDWNALRNLARKR